MSPTLKTTREQRDAWYKEATAAQTQRNPMPARICDLIEDIDRLLALHDPAEGSKRRDPLRHAIAQEGKDGRPDTSGRWATLCEGVETPNPNIETAKNSYDVTCPVCAKKLLVMGCGSQWERDPALVLLLTKRAV